MKVKLGQQIKFKVSHKIPLAKGGTALVKVGDIATVVKKIDNKTAEIIYSTGEAKGLSYKIHVEVDDTLDADLIAKKILSKMSKF